MGAARTAVHAPAPEDTADCLRKLPTICGNRGVGIGVPVADREFFATSVMRMLTDEGADCTICAGTPRPSRGRSAGLRRVGGRGSKPWIVVSDGNGGSRCAGAIAERRRCAGGGGGRDCDDPDLPPHERCIMLATNSPDLDAGECDRRRGIKTRYRQIEHAGPRTISKNAELRAFCFLYGTMPFDGGRCSTYCTRPGARRIIRTGTGRPR